MQPIVITCTELRFLQWASNQSLQRGAADLADITASATTTFRGAHLDEFSIESLDIHAMGKQFGL